MRKLIVLNLCIYQWLLIEVRIIVRRSTVFSNWVTYMDAIVLEFIFKVISISIDYVFTVHIASHTRESTLNHFHLSSTS